MSGVKWVASSAGTSYQPQCVKLISK